MSNDNSNEQSLNSGVAENKYKYMYIIINKNIQLFFIIYYI